MRNTELENLSAKGWEEPEDPSELLVGDPGMP